MEDSDTIILYDDNAKDYELLRISFDEFVSMSLDDSMRPEVAREWADKLTAFAHNMDELVDTGPDSE
jgi:hypothetical protein